MVWWKRSTVQLKTWAHGGAPAKVNPGAGACDFIERNYSGSTYRLWHESGRDDAGACTLFGRPDGFNPDMPTGWLQVIPGAVLSIAKQAETRGCMGPGLEAARWRPGSPNASEAFVCRYEGYHAPPGHQASSDWFHGLPWKEREGQPRDIYMRLEDDGLAQKFRPNLRFDSGEKWRPLEVEHFLEERQDNPAMGHRWDGGIFQSADLVRWQDLRQLSSESAAGAIDINGTTDDPGTFRSPSLGQTP